MGPIWVLSAPDGPHVGPINLAIRDILDYVHAADTNIFYSGMDTDISMGWCKIDVTPLPLLTH